ncbi:MAG: response regulator transcription factor [Firmicutes bacterium]|nr:response regulator transcription factor [Bacillota bacterium]
MRILLVEDEPGLCAALSALLTKQNYTVDTAMDGVSALSKALTGIYDGIILDIMLPRLDGLQIVSSLRQAQQNVPVLLLSARAEIEDKIQGLDAGANDYMTKPFSSEELLARVRAMTRGSGKVTSPILTYHDLSLHLQSGYLACNLQQVQLGAKEFMIMELFLRNPEQILTKEQLTHKVWGPHNQSEYNNVEVYISFIRKKIAAVGSSVQIRTIRGLGYKLEGGAPV